MAKNAKKRAQQMKKAPDQVSSTSCAVTCLPNSTMTAAGQQQKEPKSEPSTIVCTLGSTTTGTRSSEMVRRGKIILAKTFFIVFYF